MKKYFLIFLIAMPAVWSCSNQEKEFPDFTEQNVYFPIQYPVRTLVLGESRLDNSIDLEHAFNIGVNIGGMYENKKNWNVEYEVDPTLIEGIEANSIANVKSEIKVMPSSYFTIAPQNKVTIPKGSFTGKIRVNLTDEFFNDPQSHLITYVVPLKITKSDAGVLSGSSTVNNPNLHNSSDWSASKKPRHYTLFAIKYINPWHGTFFQRGKQIKNETLDKTFHTQDIERGQISSLITSGYRNAIYTRMGEFTKDENRTKLTFGEENNGEGTITISAIDNSAYTVSGTGKYYKSSTDFAKEYGSWLVDPKDGKEFSHLTLVLDYKVDGLNGANYQFVDTLVFRDNGVKYEEFTPIIK